MAKSKYRFKKEFKDAQIMHPAFREVISADNLTDAHGDLIFKAYPQFAHNLELIGEEEETKAKKTKAQDSEDKE